MNLPRPTPAAADMQAKGAEPGACGSPGASVADDSNDADGHTASAPSARRLDSGALLAGDSEVEIDHRGVVYRLRITALGKLILTK